MLLLCFLAFAGSINTSITPVQKVVQLLNELKEKGKEEKHLEAVQFATYKQFCEDTARGKEQAEIIASMRYGRRLQRTMPTRSA